MIDPAVLMAAVSAVIGGLGGIVTSVLGNRKLRTQLKVLRARRDQDKKDATEEIAKCKNKSDTEILAIRKEHGDALVVHSARQELLTDEMTAMGLEHAETVLQMAGCVEQLRTLTGNSKTEPPPLVSQEAAKILSQARAYRIFEDEGRQSKGTSGNILLVEDHDEVRRQTANYLRNRGYAVETASGVSEARRKIDARERPLHLVLLDLMLRDAGNGNGAVGGDAVAEHLRIRGSKAPILLVTAMDQWDARSYVKRLGAVGLVRKPYEFPDLIASIAEHIRK